MKRKTVTIYGIDGPGYDRKLKLVSCEAFERTTTYYVPSHPSWLGFRTIFYKSGLRLCLSAEAAIRAHVRRCYERVWYHKRVLKESQHALVQAEAFLAKHVKGKR